MTNFDMALLDIDYLIFSSHKTATQTIATTLRVNKFICIHCHSLDDETTKLELGTFKSFLQQYYLKNKKIDIITVFREPIERHISSFFQWYGEGVIRQKKVESITDTIIHKNSVKELQEKLISQLASQTHVGKLESINQICDELKLNISNLNYNVDKQYGLVEIDDCRLFIFRFDVLIREKRLKYLLSHITGRQIRQNNANISGTKWYYNTYKTFIKSLKIPRQILIQIYETKHDLIDLLYPGEYDKLLSEALDKYGES